MAQEQKIKNLGRENLEFESQIEKLKYDIENIEKAKDNYKAQFLCAKVEKQKLKQDFDVKENEIKDEFSKQIKKINGETVKEGEAQNKIKVNIVIQ